MDFFTDKLAGLPRTYGGHTLSKNLSEDRSDVKRMPLSTLSGNIINSLPSREDLKTRSSEISLKNSSKDVETFEQTSNLAHPGLAKLATKSDSQHQKVVHSSTVLELQKEKAQRLEIENGKLKMQFQYVGEQQVHMEKQREQLLQEKLQTVSQKLQLESEMSKLRVENLKLSSSASSSPAVSPPVPEASSHSFSKQQQLLQAQLAKTSDRSKMMLQKAEQKLEDASKRVEHNTKIEMKLAGFKAQLGALSDSPQLKMESQLSEGHSTPDSQGMQKGVSFSLTPGRLQSKSAWNVTQLQSENLALVSNIEAQTQKTYDMQMEVASLRNQAAELHATKEALQKEKVNNHFLVCKHKSMLDRFNKLMAEDQVLRQQLGEQYEIVQRLQAACSDIETTFHFTQTLRKDLESRVTQQGHGGVGRAHDSLNVEELWAATPPLERMTKTMELFASTACEESEGNATRASIVSRLKHELEKVHEREPIPDRSSETHAKLMELERSNAVLIEENHMLMEEAKSLALKLEEASARLEPRQAEAEREQRQRVDGQVAEQGAELERLRAELAALRHHNTELEHQQLLADERMAAQQAAEDKMKEMAEECSKLHEEMQQAQDWLDQALSQGEVNRKEKAKEKHMREQLEQEREVLHAELEKFKHTVDSVDGKYQQEVQKIQAESSELDTVVQEQRDVLKNQLQLIESSKARMEAAEAQAAQAKQELEHSRSALHKQAAQHDAQMDAMRVQVHEQHITRGRLETQLSAMEAELKGLQEQSAALSASLEDASSKARTQEHRLKELEQENETAHAALRETNEELRHQEAAVEEAINAAASWQERAQIDKQQQVKAQEELREEHREEVGKLRKQAEEAEQQHSKATKDLEAQAASFQQQLARTEDRPQASMQAADSWQMRATQEHQSLVAMQEEREAAHQAVISTMRADMESASARHLHMQSKLESDVSHLTDEVQRAKERAEASEQAATSWEKRAKGDQQELASVKDELESATQKLGTTTAASDQKYAILLSELQTIQSEKDRSSKHAEELTAAKELIIQRLESTTEQVKVKEVTIQQLEETLSSVRSQLTLSEEGRQMALSSLSEASEQVRETTDKYTLKTQECERLVQDCIFLTHQAEELTGKHQAETKELQQQLKGELEQRLTVQLQERQKESTAAQDRVRALEKELHAAALEREEVAARAEQSEKLAVEARSEVMDMEERVKASSEQVRVIEQQLHSVSMERTRLLTQVEHAQKELHRVEAGVEATVEHRIKIQQLRDSAEKAKAISKEDYDSMVHQVSSLHSQLASAEQSKVEVMHSLQAQLNQLRGELEDTRSKEHEALAALQEHQHVKQQVNTLIRAAQETQKIIQSSKAGLEQEHTVRVRAERDLVERERTIQLLAAENDDLRQRLHASPRSGSTASIPQRTLAVPPTPTMNGLQANINDNMRIINMIEERMHITPEKEREGLGRAPEGGGGSGGLPRTGPTRGSLLHGPAGVLHASSAHPDAHAVGTAVTAPTPYGAQEAGLNHVRRLSPQYGHSPERSHEAAPAGADVHGTASTSSAAQNTRALSMEEQHQAWAVMSNNATLGVVSVNNAEDNTSIAAVHKAKRYKSHAKQLHHKLQQQTALYRQMCGMYEAEIRKARDPSAPTSQGPTAAPHAAPSMGTSDATAFAQGLRVGISPSYAANDPQLTSRWVGPEGQDGAAGR